MSGNETSTMMRPRPTRTKSLKKMFNAFSFVLFFQLLQWPKCKHRCVFWFLKAAKKKEIKFCPQCGDLCHSVTSSVINIALAFRLVKLLMHSFQYNTRIYHKTVPLKFFVCVTLFQNELFHRTPSLLFSWQYRQRNIKVKVYRRHFFCLYTKQQ
jgi:hypothetical protein